jgi:hypothetical protein
MLSLGMRNLFTAWVVYQYEVINMHMKGWPFDPIEEVTPLGDGGGPLPVPG